MKIVQARNWLHPDISSKSKQIIETALSYSHTPQLSDFSRSAPILPDTGSGYDIAYLGMAPLLPLGKDSTTTLENDYDTSLAALRALNMSEGEDTTTQDPYKATANCGPPDGVMIFQWPAAIICWLTSLMPPRIMAGSCGGSTI
jgi:hypothetical protein